MNLEKMWKPAAIGGILLGVLSSLPPFSCACCVWMIGGGFLAAYLYVKKSFVVVTLGQGVLLGFIAGVIGTIIFELIQIPQFEGGQGLVEQVRQIMEEMPGFTEENRKTMEELISREGFISFLYIMSIAVQFVINCLLAMLGGALGVALFEKRKPQDPFSQESGGEPPSSLPPLPPNE